MRDPNGDTEYCCVECPLKFSDKTLMEQHLSAHNREYRFLCGICGTANTSRPTIRNALSRVKQAEMEPPDDPERPHVCLVCGKRYKRRDHLKLHSVSHMEKDKICLECGKVNG
ncbi:hypothetical protein MSG28_011509 [Choristoneura fumiferana]|uniref:Uncharacterized protein n=1 Tax=Choristoneura fumiferana TaxID=7141 RepID=A0ACC0JNH5_CHOFU|nr:hypothetical protein MSG28_011509 [Choristoneura fumiferana]